MTTSSQIITLCNLATSFIIGSFSSFSTVFYLFTLLREIESWAPVLHSHLPWLHYGQNVFPALEVGLYLWLACISGRRKENDSPKLRCKYFCLILAPLPLPLEELALLEEAPWLLQGGWETCGASLAKTCSKKQSHPIYGNLTADTKLSPIQMSWPLPNLHIHELNRYLLLYVIKILCCIDVTIIN